MLTAGSARGVAEGLDDLLARARARPVRPAVIMAGGGLLPEHVPWLARAGVRAFHLGAAVRPLRSYKAYVDADLVRTWRELIDDAVPRAAESGDDDLHRSADLAGARPALVAPDQRPLVRGAARLRRRGWAFRARAFDATTTT